MNGENPHTERQPLEAELDLRATRDGPGSTTPPEQLRKAILDYFDDEPSTGGGYDDGFVIPLDGADAIARRIIVRYRRADRGGGFERASIILEEVRDAVEGTLMRYDDAHGRFHRHFPGWPEPSREIAEYFDQVPKNQRTAFATAAISARYTVWEVEVFGQKESEFE